MAGRGPGTGRGLGRGPGVGGHPLTPELTPRDILRVCSLSSDLLRTDSLGTTAESWRADGG